MWQVYTKVVVSADNIDQPYPALCSLDVEIDYAVGDLAILSSSPQSHRGHDNTVLDLHVGDFDGLKKLSKFSHCPCPSLFLLNSVSQDSPGV